MPTEHDLLAFPHHADARGHLAFFEARRHVPYAIGTVDWWVGDDARTPGPRAASPAERMSFAIAGQVALRVAGGSATILDRPDRGVVIPAGVPWELTASTAEAVLVTVGAPAGTGVAGNPVASASEGGCLPRVADARLVVLRTGGDAVHVAGGLDVPFEVARLYYLFEVPDGKSRGAHAHKALQQLIVAVRGSFDIRLDDGTGERVVRLDRADVGLCMPRMLWRDLENFSCDAVCLVLASLPYDEADYIRDYAEFVAHRRLTH